MKTKHEWKDGNRAFLVEADGSLYETPDIGESPQCGELPGFVAREFLRLAAREEALERDKRLALDAGNKLARKVAELDAEVEVVLGLMPTGEE